jgi:hypothetical protein
MNTRIFSLPLILALSFAVFSEQALCEKLYKWVDESGKINFADQVTAEENKYKLEKLGKNAQVIEVIEKPKTPEQLQQEKRLADLRKEQDKLIADQIIHDKSLLSTYQTVEDMLKVLKIKMQSLDSQRESIKIDLGFQVRELEQKQAAAAVFERNAQKIPEKLLEEIKNSQDRVLITKQAITESINNQKRVKSVFEADVKRFETLTRKEQKDSVSIAKAPSIEESNALGLFRCENDLQCNQAWDIALGFVREHKSSPPAISTDRLIMEAEPTDDNDFSMSVSRIGFDANNFALFLDFHCRDTSIGKELCDSQKVQDLRESFQPYVNERLRAKSSSPGL